MSKEHVSYVKAHEAHSSSSGCIIYCTSRYEPGNPHSHRWHAANQARGEGRVPYADFPLFESRRFFRPKAILEGLQKRGGIEGAITPDGRTYTGMVRPFHSAEHPFPHNAHHIIPSGEIEGCINKVVAKAAPNEGRMQDLVVGGLLTEPYNNNDQPNMIVLPTELEASEVTGLPKHTAQSASSGRNLPQHMNYSAMVRKQLRCKFVKLYRSLSSAVAAEVHPKDQKVPTAGPMMVAISRQTYEAIISIAQARSAVGATMDSTAREILRLARRSSSR
ncbi:MAG: hypothetical protein AB1Z98_22490 [Nannocystaceae bacterium]